MTVSLYVYRNTSTNGFDMQVIISDPAFGIRRRYYNIVAGEHRSIYGKWTPSYGSWESNGDMNMKNNEDDYVLEYYLSPSAQNIVYNALSNEETFEDFAVIDDVYTVMSYYNMPI